MFAVLQLPNFHLQAALRHEPGALTGSVALLDEDPRVERSRDKIRITQITDAARRFGVELGMTATQGQARCANLRIVNRSTASEQVTQETLLQWAGSSSPRIESTGDGVCTIDLTGTRFDHEPELLGERCVAAFTRMELVAQIGIAANPELALLAAKFAAFNAPDSNATPVTSTNSVASDRVGLSEKPDALFPLTPALSLEERENPRPSVEPAKLADSIPRRPGQSPLLGERARVKGNKADNDAPVDSSPFKRTLSRVRIIEPTAAAARRFLAPLPIDALSASPELVAVLRIWGLRKLGELAALPKEGVVERLGPEALPLWRQLSGGEPRPLKLHRPVEILTEALDFEHPVEQLDALLFVLNRFLHSLEVRLAEMYLVTESLTLELRFEDGTRHERGFRIPEPTRDIELLLRTLHTHLENFRAAAPVVGVRLTATPARQPQQQLDLFQPSLRDPNRFAETLSRLEALLGAGRVGSPEVLPTHRPDAFKVAPFNPDSEPALPRDAKPPVRFGLALRRFRPPLPARIELKQELDAETLLRISAIGIHGKIRASRGPWLASGDWWDQRPWQRREWDIELEDGGLYRLAQQDDQWQVDGEYD